MCLEAGPAGPLRNVRSGRRTKPAEVAPGEVVEGGIAVDVLGPDSALGRLEQVRAALVRGARRRDAHELEPRADVMPAPAGQLVELLVPPCATRHRRAQLIDCALELPFSSRCVRVRSATLRRYPSDADPTRAA